MGLVTREILHTGRKTARVAVPEWDGEILLRALSAAQVFAYPDYVKAQAGRADANIRNLAWLLIATWVDEAGQPVLTLDDLDEVLATQTTTMLVRLGDEIRELSGATNQASASAEKN